MQKDDLVYVGHMLDMSRKALELAAGKSRESFDQDEALALALTHLLQVIGEAARKISSTFKEQHPEIPWRAIVGMPTKLFMTTYSLTGTWCGLSSVPTLKRLPAIS